MSKNYAYNPPRCWVGDSPKISYPTREEAETAALVAQYDHGGPKLSVYKCEYGDHWHLTKLRTEKSYDSHDQSQEL